MLLSFAFFKFKLQHPAVLGPAFLLAVSSAAVAASPAAIPLSVAQVQDASLLAGALSCAVLFPPDGKAEGWDAADALSEGFEVQEFLSSAARITVQPPAAEEPDIPGENAVWATDDALALSFTRPSRKTVSFTRVPGALLPISGGSSLGW